jgi:transcription termination factor Rho
MISDIPDIGRAENEGEGFDDQRNNGQRRGRYRRFRHRNNNNNRNSGNQQHGGPQSASPPGPPQQHNGQFAGRRNRRNRPFDNTPRGPIGPVTVDGEAAGWIDMQRDAGFIRSPKNSYLADPNDALIPLSLARQYGLRRGDAVTASVGHDQRNRLVAVDITSVNGEDPTLALRRADFQSLIASYPDRKLTLETGKPAKGGPELTRRAIDLIAPVGYGQRALIVAPARAGKTMLLQAVIEGIAINHPEAALFVLLVDERPEEVSDMITLGYGEVIASSFDMPAARHTDVAEMTLERARRLVELGRDVVIVLDSITRLARAYNTVERGTGRTLSGGLDSSAMAKPKAFFGSARAVAPEHGGGSLTIIATALVETGSRMDDVIFEEFKGTGNSEIKLDRSLAEKRIFPAIDIAISGTRREDKLFRPDQLEHVYMLRRGLQQMPSSAGMEWLIKRIASTTNNDNLLTGL